MQHVWIGREIEWDLDTDAQASFAIKTELAVRDITEKWTRTFDTESTTTGRRTVNFRLPGNLKWHLIQFQVVPSGIARLFGARIFAKRLGIQDSWQWYALPIPITPEAWSEAPLPIAPTPEAWAIAPLPIPDTPEGWSAAHLPIPGTPESFTEAALPIAGTPEGWSEAPVPIPPTAEAWHVAALPIAETDERWSEAALPLKASPPEPLWVEVPVSDE